MNSALKSLQLAIDVATQRRDQASRVLAGAERTHAQACAQIDQLQGYAAETAGRWATGARSVTSPEMLHHHYQFMDRLQQAVVMQEGVIADLARRAEEARQRYLATETRLAGLQKILDRRQAELSAQQARREQKEMDEFAALQYGRVRRELTLESHHEY